tara:strand:+ start:242 stop:436 length:195 start_codon:yes stop_codon:yes gene_type:complete
MVLDLLLAQLEVMAVLEAGALAPALFVLLEEMGLLGKDLMAVIEQGLWGVLYLVQEGEALAVLP